MPSRRAGIAAARRWPGGELLGSFAVAMDHPADRTRLPKQRANARPGVPHVEHDREAEPLRERELAAEGPLLRLERRAPPRVVEPDLADRDDVAVARELRERARDVVAPRFGPVRMHADRDAHVIVPARERKRGLARREVFAGGEHALDADVPSALEDQVDVVGEASIGEMSVCVDHGQRLVWAHARAHLRRHRAEQRSGTDQATHAAHRRNVERHRHR